MATAGSLKIEEQVQPAPPVRPAEPGRAPRRRWPIWVACSLALMAILAVSLWLARRDGPAKVAVPGGPTYVAATRGPLVRSLRLAGVVAAVEFAGVAAPQLRGVPGQGGGGFGPVTLVYVAPAGAMVKKDDVLAEFERQAQRNNFEERRAEFVSLTDQIAKRRAELDIEREQRETELIKARSDQDGAKLENRRNEVISKIDAEKNQQTLAEAEATLTMLRQTLKPRLEAAEAELKLLEIRRERERLQMENARMNYERLIVKSPIAGMVVRMAIWKGSQMGLVQEGDQVRPGGVFLQVVNPKAMLVRARVNQLDAGRLRVGAAAEVCLDAYPDLKFPGRVETVSTLAQTTQWSGQVKVFSVVVSVRGSDPRLIPDISASVDVELERAPDSVLAPRGAVVRQAAATEAGFVWVKNGKQAQPRSVTLGPRNDTQWSVQSGLKEGEMILAIPGPEELAALGHNGDRGSNGGTSSK